MKKYYLLLAASIICEVFGTTMLKASNGFAELAPTALFIVGYLACFTLLTFALKGLPLGAAYGIWSGVGVAAVSIIGAVIWHDPFNFVVFFGIALVIIGVVLLETSSDESPKAKSEILPESNDS